MTRAVTGLIVTSILGICLNVGTISAQTPTSGPPVPDLVGPSSADLPSVDGPSWRSRMWNAIGGAALGAGVGYFASQVASGDWDDGDIGRSRQEWAMVGGSIGLAAGFTFPFLGRGGTLSPSVRSNPRTIITAGEVSDAAANTAYDLVRLLRPRWLASRRPSLVADNTCAAGTPVCEPIAVDEMKVYLDGHRLGGTSTLTEINARNVESIRFFSPAEAVARWGAGNGYGAILVNTIG